jgi:hypothetical protein
MRTSIRYSTISHISGAVAGLWLCGAGAAWAGGGADFGTLTALLTTGTGTGICDVFHIKPCPTVPSITQAALQVAALGNNLSEMLLLQNQFAPASRVNANNPPATAADIPPDPTGQGRPILPTASSVFSVLSRLTPLAFISQSLGTAHTPGTAPVTQLLDTSADTFLYAVGLSTTGTTGQKAPLPLPNYVYFFYDDLFRFNLSFATGTTVAKFTFPLRVLNSDGSSERAVPTTLNFVATNAGDCSMSTVVGDFAGKGGGASQSLTPDQIGINCQVVLSASPASAQTHAIFEVAVPLLVITAGLDLTAGDSGQGQCSSTATQCPDPLYFYSFATPKDPTTNKVLSNPVNSPRVTQGVYTAFQSSTGQPAPSPPATNFLGTGIAIGLAPSAAPLCSDLGVVCSSTPMANTFPICANLPTKNTANSVPLRPAVGAYYAMATSGETLLSAALGTESTSTCSLF